MNIQEMAQLLMKVQLGDNRHVDKLVIEYWMDTIGDLELGVAVDALRRFRRERPGTYLEPGHLLELAGVDVAAPDPWTDITAEIVAASKARALQAAGVTEAEYEEHKTDLAWVRAKFDRLEVTE